MASYAFGREHPLQPSRYTLTMSLLTDFGWLAGSDVDVESPRAALLDDLLAVHSYPYVEAVARAQAVAEGEREPFDLTLYGLGTSDNPIFPSMHDASVLYTGATVQAMRALMDGRAIHAYSPAGGQHHAMRDRASGFCVYNDCAVAIATAVAAGHRVAYVDLDAHHGDGVQTAFYDEPRVLTISVHESGRYLFPGTGDVDEMGTGRGLGTSINVPLPPRTGDSAILEALELAVIPALRLYAPDIVVTQTGCDTHHLDPLTHLAATLPVYPRLASRLHEVVHHYCSGRWLVVGGGGYDPVDVTPRAWTAFVGTILGHETAEADLPEKWIRASRRLGGHPPKRLLDDRLPAFAPVGRDDLTSLFTCIQDTALAELRRSLERE